MAIITKRTIMSLYSNHDDIYSHQVRIVLAEKGVNVDITPMNSETASDDLLAINPYGSMPTLIDRDLVLYEPRIIMEYLDERFPHPPLLPVYPVARAETRKMMYRIEQDWYGLANRIQTQTEPSPEAQGLLTESLLAIEAVFADKQYFLSEEFSLLDCVLAPLLWRLPALGVSIPESATGIMQYMERLFKRDSFESSLTDAERLLRTA